MGFEPTISAGERPKTYALDRAAIGTGYVRPLVFVNSIEMAEFCAQSFGGLPVWRRIILLISVTWGKVSLCFVYRNFTDWVFIGSFFFTNPKHFTEQLTSPVDGHIQLFIPAKFHMPSPVHWNHKFYFVIPEHTNETSIFKAALLSPLAERIRNNASRFKNSITLPKQVH